MPVFTTCRSLAAPPAARRAQCAHCQLRKRLAFAVGDLRFAFMVNTDLRRRGKSAARTQALASISKATRMDACSRTTRITARIGIANATVSHVAWNHTSTDHVSSSVKSTAALACSHAFWFYRGGGDMSLSPEAGSEPNDCTAAKVTSATALMLKARLHGHLNVAAVNKVAVTKQWWYGATI